MQINHKFHKLSQFVTLSHSTQIILAYNFIWSYYLHCVFFFVCVCLRDFIIDKYVSTPPSCQTVVVANRFIGRVHGHITAVRGCQ